MIPLMIFFTILGLYQHIEIYTSCIQVFIYFFDSSEN